MKSHVAATLAALLYLHAGALAKADTPAHAAFLDALVDNWDGRAVRTPHGPLPYDIEFSRSADGAIAGLADPGAALHHWRFLVEDGQLRLRFLTTFGGNTTLIWLNAETVSQTAVMFRAEDPPSLHVRVTNTGEEVNMDVFLHGEPHVNIRLLRKR